MNRFGFVGRSKIAMFLGLLTALFSAAIFAHTIVKWGYEGNIAPHKWGSLTDKFSTCKNGQLQAPINIPSELAEKSGDPIEIFYRPTNITVVNNEHTIQIDLQDGGYASLSGTDFHILQFHMHTPSEETINGERFPLNAHLVHVAPDDSIEDNEAGTIAVIGLFFKEGKENLALKPIFDNMPLQPGKVKLPYKFDLTALLPESLSYYNYAGSFTTPPCTEGVQFYILKTPVEISSEQLNKFQNLFPMNARPLSPLNGRQIIEGS